MADEGPSEIWVAQGATGDDPHAPGNEIVGVFSTEQKALEAARAVFPNTAFAEEYELDVPFLDEGDR